MEKKYQQKPSNCVKVVLFESEFTGKTILSKKLAIKYIDVLKKIINVY